jgi:hypothetical protein
VHDLINQASWFGEVATLHPLFVGGPILAALAAGWIAVRRRRFR